MLEFWRQNSKDILRLVARWHSLTFFLRSKGCVSVCVFPACFEKFPTLKMMSTRRSDGRQRIFSQAMQAAIGRRFSSPRGKAFDLSDSGVSMSPQSPRSSNSSECGSVERHERPNIDQQEELELEMIARINVSKNQKSAYRNAENNVKNMHGQTSKTKGRSEDCCGTYHDRPFFKKNQVAKIPSYDANALMSFKSKTGFFDSHCHIDFLFDREKFQGTYADYIAEHKESYPKSYNGCIAVFCKPFTFAQENFWRGHLEQNNVWGAFGCHPKSAKFYDFKVEEDLKNALDHPKVKALGEIGLDYSKGNKSSKVDQHFVFRRQLQIAQRRKLRLVIHCRDADDDAIKIMHEILPKDTIFHLHCFTGSWERAQHWMKEFPNVFIGITNLVTFPSATKTHEVARCIPLDRLLLETDAPYFVPTAVNGKFHYSHPGLAIHVAAQIAAFKGIPLDEVLQWTCANTKLVYNLEI